ncbi:MAG TPA: glycosyltransferase [Casimicrobiaceae bacterium]
MSIVIPDRDAPDMLAAALASVDGALRQIDEPNQVIVVANGAPESGYAGIRAAFAHVEFAHSDLPLGFGAAIARGLAQARHDWVYLMNNDMTLDRAALFEAASQRSRGVFSVSSQIFQRSADGRREETGFTDWYVDRDGVHVFHAMLGDSELTRPHLAGSGGATLFRTAPLTRYVRESRCYDPFYWEDIEWGVRAWRDGYSVLLHPASHAFHRHRATTARFYPIEEIDRIIARNRVLFDARNRATPFGGDWLMNRVCDLDYRTQREIAAGRVALETFRRRRRAVRSSPSAPSLADPREVAVELPPASFSYRLRPFESKSTAKRPRLLLVTPFAVHPPRHGGARRIAGLLAHLRHDYDVILVSDEAALYDGRSLAGFDRLCAVHLVWRVEDAQAKPSDTLERRMESHAHKALWETLRCAVSRYRPALVQIEYAELAGLVRLRSPGERWVLDLHDAIDDGDFTSPEIARRFEQEVLRAYDAVTVCSEEDRAIVSHATTVCIPNASSVELGGYRPSDSTRLLFMGPFRYEPNLQGVRRFLQDAFPKIRSAIPDARMAVLGGDGAQARVRNDPAFTQSGVEVFDHRDDVAGFLDASALTINPQTDIRGSSIKVIESLTAGRVCVSTVDGARGFRDAKLAGLVLADDIASMVDPTIALLRDPALRHRTEAPDASRLARYQWAHSAQLQRALYDSLLART